MSDFTSEFTNLFLCNETSGTVLKDSIGGKDSDGIIGSPTPLGDRWELRGDALRWTLPNTYLLSGADYSDIIAFRAVDPSQPFIPFVFGTSGTTTPVLLHDANGMTYDANQNGASLQVSTSGALSATDIIVVARSYRHSDRQMHMAIKSSEGLDLFGSRVDATPQAVTGATVIASNGPIAVLTDMDLHRLGFVNLFKPLQDLKDTAAAFLDVVLNPPPPLSISTKFEEAQHRRGLYYFGGGSRLEEIMAIPSIPVFADTTLLTADSVQHTADADPVLI